MSNEDVRQTDDDVAYRIYGVANVIRDARAVVRGVMLTLAVTWKREAVVPMCSATVLMFALAWVEVWLDGRLEK